MTKSAAIPSSKGRDLTWIVALAVIVVWAFFIHSRTYSTNDASRMASIESLVHRGTWHIDDSPFKHTLDKIQVNGRFVSDKPPVLSFLGAGVYAVLHHGLGLTLQTQGCEPDRTVTNCRALLETAEADWAYFILTLLLIAVPGVVILTLTYRLARNQGFSNGPALLLVGFLGFGTAVFPFSVVFVNHVPAAAALFIALYLLITRPQPDNRTLGLAGFSAALAVTLDLSAGIFAIGITAFVLWRYQRRALWFVAGTLPPALLLALLDLWIVGNPLPPQFYAQGYVYEGSVLHGNLSGFQSAENPFLYAFRLLFGDRGAIAFFPIILWFVYALIQTAKAPKETTRILARIMLICTPLYLLYFMLSTDNFGGFAFSPRWMLLPVPLLALFAALSPNIYRPLRNLVLIGILGVVSVAGTYRGALNPWNPTLPLLHLSYETPDPRQYRAVVISGYNSFDEIAPALRAGFGDDHVLRRWVVAQSGMVVPAQPAWWFINENAPPHPLIAAKLGLPTAAPFYFYGNLESQAEQWLTTDFNATIYQSDALVPPPAEAAPASLPQTFMGANGSVALIGFNVTRQDGTLTLTTAWEVMTRGFVQPGERRAFVHVLAADGSIAAQNDFFAADYDSLFPGDKVFQIQQIPLDGLPPGNYWLQIGLYSPETAVRFLTESGADRILLQNFDIE